MLKYYPQPCGDLSSMLQYLFNDVASPLLCPTSLRVCNVAIFKECLCSLGDLWATTFKICRQQRDFAAGISALVFFRVGLGPSPPSPLFSLLKFYCSCRYPISALFECTTDGTDARSRARGRRSSRCQRAPLRADYPHGLAFYKQKRFTHAPSRHGRIRKCEGMKAAMKAKRAHVEI
jgi:hypothetical protein